MCPLFTGVVLVVSVFGCLQGKSGSRVPLVGEEGLAAQGLKDIKVLYSCCSLEARFI